MSDPCANCPCPEICLGWDVFCGWAAEEPPDPVKLRHICGRSALPSPSPADFPPLATQATTLTRALWDWATSGFRLASDAEQSRRRAICAGCENWVAPSRRCKICGCYTEAKIRMRTGHCPLPAPKW